MSHTDTVFRPVPASAATEFTAYPTPFRSRLPTQQIRPINNQVITNALAEQSLRRADLTQPNMSPADQIRLQRFWEAGLGPNFTFLLHYWPEWHTGKTVSDTLFRDGGHVSVSALDQPLIRAPGGSAVSLWHASTGALVTAAIRGDGSTTTFQAALRYDAGNQVSFRKIFKFQDGTNLDPALPRSILVARASTPLTAGYTQNLATGIVTYTSAPASGVSVTWGGAFYIIVKFVEEDVGHTDEGYEDQDVQYVVEEVPGLHTE